MPAPKHWETQVFRLRPYAEVCDCGAFIFPPRDVCPKCGQNVLPEGQSISLDKMVLHGDAPENIVFMGNPGKEGRR